LRKSVNLNFRSDNAYLLYVAFLKLILLLIFAGNYGLFRDEFYYIECSKHLDWGFVDQPPLSVFLLWLSRTLFGESILGIRIFAYTASCATVFVSGLIARELGGKRFAQILTAVCVVFSPVVLGGGSYFSMNAFDILFSSILFYLLIKIIKTENQKLWLLVGIVFGIGLQNKLSFLFLGLGLAAALLLTKQRRYFLSKDIYIAAAAAFLIFLPHLIWQTANGFPTLEFIRNAAERKNIRMGFAEYFIASMMEMNPAYIILLSAALYYLFFDKAGKRFALLAWFYLVILAVFVLNSGKPYYMGILFPMIIAAGVVGAESLTNKYFIKSGRIILLFTLIPSYLLIAPFAIPVLSVESFLKFSEAVGIKPSSGERILTGVLPQFFADRFGWKEMAGKVSEAYNKLSENEKKEVVIFAQNYGEAGAVNYYSGNLGFPGRVYSPHNSYWLWGPPSDWTGTVAIIVGSTAEDNIQWFEEVELAASHRSRFGMPYENVDIFICRKIKIPIEKVWASIKVFI